MFQLGTLAGQLVENARGVGQAGENLGSEDGLIRKFRQARTERQQMAREVAAVHAGNIERQQGRECARVIPIEEVAPMSFEALHGVEGVEGAPQELAHRQIAEIARGQIGQQGQSHVGGRSAGSHHRDRIFLEIIRRQPVFLRRDEGFKKAPRLARRSPKEGGLLRRQLRRRRKFNGLADAPGDPGGNQPEAQERRGQRQLRRLHQG